MLVVSGVIADCGGPGCAGRVAELPAGMFPRRWLGSGAEDRPCADYCWLNADTIVCSQPLSAQGRMAARQSRDRLASGPVQTGHLGHGSELGNLLACYRAPVPAKIREQRASATGGKAVATEVTAQRVACPELKAASAMRQEALGDCLACSQGSSPTRNVGAAPRVLRWDTLSR